MSKRDRDIKTKVDSQMRKVILFRNSLKSMEDLEKQLIADFRMFFSPQMYTFLSSSDKCHCGEVINTIGEVRDYLRRNKDKMRIYTYYEIASNLNLIEIACFPDKNNDELNRNLLSRADYGLWPSGFSSQLSKFFIFKIPIYSDSGNLLSVIDYIFNIYHNVVLDKKYKVTDVRNIGTRIAAEFFVKAEVIFDYYFMTLNKNNDNESDVFECVYAKFHNYVDDLKRQAEKILKGYEKKFGSPDLEIEWIASFKRERRLKSEIQQYYSAMEILNELNIAKIILAEMEAYKNEKISRNEKVLVKKANEVINN